MAIQYSATLRNNRLDEITGLAGATSWLQVWDGALPATPITAPAGTLLASLACANPLGAAASAGVLTVTAPTDDTNANASGTPTFFRIATSETGTTTGIVQGSAAVGSGDLNFDAAIVIAGTVSVTALSITDGSS
jgi:hypothetical protein